MTAESGGQSEGGGDTPGSFRNMTPARAKLVGFPPHAMRVTPRLGAPGLGPAALSPALPVSAIEDGLHRAPAPGRH